MTKKKKNREKMRNLLTVARLSILPLSTVNKSRSFCVKTMQTIGLLVNKGIILRNKLPSDFRRNNRRGIRTHASIYWFSWYFSVIFFIYTYIKWNRLKRLKSSQETPYYKRQSFFYSTPRSAFGGGSRIHLLNPFQSSSINQISD